MFVAIEGIDGVGKGTQCALLSRRLEKEGLRCLLLSFPIYSSFFGQLIGEYLNGVYGDLETVPPKLASLLYALDRWHGMSRVRLSDYDVVIADRYVPSNLAHQGGKFDPVVRPSFVEWLETLEYRILGIAKPDLVVLLDAPCDVAAAQVLTKKPRSYTESKADLHESNAEYLQKVRTAFLDLASRDTAFRVVNCCNASRMRDQDAIHEEIWALLVANGATAKARG